MILVQANVKTYSVQCRSGTNGTNGVNALRRGNKSNVQKRSPLTQVNENRTCLSNLIASTSIKTNTQQQRRRCDVLIRHTNILVSLQTWELNSTRAAVVSAIKP